MTPFLYFFLGAAWLGLVEALLAWWWRLEQQETKPAEPRVFAEARAAANKR